MFQEYYNIATNIASTTDFAKMELFTNFMRRFDGGKLSYT